ncbi:hypothetical protein B0J14DRAFT_589868 [Halenospora varia]|nr:hypothetical protein B0J14DRAFT_589868 [Halenospora varia]
MHLYSIIRNCFKFYWSVTKYRAALPLIYLKHSQSDIKFCILYLPVPASHSDIRRLGRIKQPQQMIQVSDHALPPNFRPFSVSRAPTLSDPRSLALHLDLDSHRMNIRPESYYRDPSSRTITSPRIYAKHPVSSRLTASRFGIYPPPLFLRCKNARQRCCHTMLCFLYTPLIQWRMEGFTWCCLGAFGFRQDSEDVCWKL